MTPNDESMRRARSRVCIALLPLALAGCASLVPQNPGGAPASAAAARQENEKSLYARLGGAEGITAFTDDFLGRATNDPAIVPFFKGLTTADLRRIRQHVFELLCSATGGPCVYSGKDMKTVHKEMEINNEIWNAFTGHLNETVARLRVPDRERNELVVIIASLKAEIVDR